MEGLDGTLSQKGRPLVVKGPEGPLTVPVRVFIHRQPLYMMLLCMLKKKINPLPHELYLHIASFLPDILPDIGGSGEQDYKRLYRLYLEAGYILGPLIRLNFDSAVDKFVAIGNPAVTAAGKITKVMYLQYFNPVWNPLTFQKAEHEVMKLDTLDQRKKTFTDPLAYTHEEWMAGYKTYALHLQGFREARLVEKDKKTRSLHLLRENKEKNDELIKRGFGGIARPLTKSACTKLLSKIQRLETDLVELEQKIAKMALYL